MPTRTGSLRPQRRSTLRPRLDDLENRRLLSASIYTVNSTANEHVRLGRLGYVALRHRAGEHRPQRRRQRDSVFPGCLLLAPDHHLGQYAGMLESSGPELIEGPAAALTISGGGPSSNFSDFTVAANVTASLSGLTIANGYTTGGGGGIDNDGRPDARRRHTQRELGERRRRSGELWQGDADR